MGNSHICAFCPDKAASGRYFKCMNKDSKKAQETRRWDLVSAPPQPIKEGGETAARQLLRWPAKMGNAEKEQAIKKAGEGTQAIVCSSPEMEAQMIESARYNAAGRVLQHPSDAAAILKETDGFVQDAQAECVAYRSIHKNSARPFGMVPPVTKDGKAAPNSQQPTRQPQSK